MPVTTRRRDDAKKTLSTMRLHSLQAVIPGSYRTPKAHTRHAMGDSMFDKAQKGHCRQGKWRNGVDVISAFMEGTQLTIIFTCIRGTKRVVRRARLICSTLHGYKDNRKKSLCCTGKTFVGKDEETVFYLRQDFACGTFGEYYHDSRLKKRFQVRMGYKLKPQRP